MSKKSGYFKMSNALDDFNYSFGAKEKAAAGLKLFGKGLFNVARYTVTEVLPEVAIKSAENNLKNKDLTDDRRSEIKERIENVKSLKEKMSGTKVNKSFDDGE